MCPRLGRKRGHREHQAKACTPNCLVRGVLGFFAQGGGGAALRCLAHLYLRIYGFLSEAMNAALSTPNFFVSSRASRMFHCCLAFIRAIIWSSVRRLTWPSCWRLSRRRQ